MEKNNQYTSNNSTGNQQTASKSVCLKYFLRLLLSPNNGWKKLYTCNISSTIFERQLFYPLLALTAVCQFLTLLYTPETSISSILQRAIIGFVSMFASNFAILAVARTLMPPTASQKSTSPFFKVFVVNSLCIYNLCYLLSLLAPQAKVLLVLGSIYTLYTVYKGIKYLHLPHDERIPASVVACILIVGLPTIIYSLLNFLMPTV